MLYFAFWVKVAIRGARLVSQDGQRGGRAIDRSHRLRLFGKEQCVTSRATSQVKRGAVRQERQEFPDDSGGFRRSIPSGDAMFRIPFGEVRWHKKGSRTPSPRARNSERSAGAARSFS